MALPNKEQLAEIASHLRKPVGLVGLEVAEMMNMGNFGMNMHALAVLNPVADDVILELGMGNGNFVKNILQLDESIEYTGTDYSTDMAELASEINAEYVKAGRAEFFDYDAVSMPFDSESYTKVFCVNTLYFWEDPLAVLKEIRRVLMFGARFILAVRPKEVMDSMPVTNFNMTKYTIPEIEALLIEAGFVIEGMTHVIEAKDFQWEEDLKKECLFFTCVKQA